MKEDFLKKPPPVFANQISPVFLFLSAVSNTNGGIE